MSRLVTTFVFSVALALLSLSSLAIEPGDPLLLEGENGLEVILIPDTGGEQALIRISGLDHPIEGVVFLTEIEAREGDSRAYRAKVDGKMRSLIVYAPSFWATSEYTAYVPGDIEPHALMLNEEGTGRLDTGELTAEYEQQAEEGRQEQLAAFNRDSATERQQASLSELDRAASKACGNQVETRVDWASLSDEQLSSLSISGYCGQVATEMAYMCRKDDRFRSDVAEIANVDCQFRESLNLTREGDTLTFTTEKDEPNQREMISGFLQGL